MPVNAIDNSYHYIIAAVDLNEDTLEDLLTYDDLFLDYFNAFLQLPVIYYYTIQQ